MNTDSRDTFSDWREGFHSPDREFFPTPIWWWSGEPLSIERLEYQMDRLLEGGVYNAVVLNLAPRGPLFGCDADSPTFLTESWWALFTKVCGLAKERGMHIWFYDQIGFSGANLQGTIVTGNPDRAGWALEERTTRYDIVPDDLQEIWFPDHAMPLAAFMREIGNEGSRRKGVRFLPIEDDRVAVDSTSPIEVTLVYAVRRGFDYFSVEACQELLNTVHIEFEKRLGGFFRSTIIGSFQDELPQLPTWSEDFAERFSQHFGYSIVPNLHYLWRGRSALATRVRRDYQELRAILSEEAFFRPFYSWHRRNGLVCGFDQQGPARDGDPIGATRLYGNYFRTMRWYGAPGSDHHGEVKIHSSLAKSYGYKRVWIEAFHSTGWGGTLEETFDWLLPWFRGGANLYSPHAVYYTTKGSTWEWAAPSTCWRQPYWIHYRGFANTIARLSFMLTRGRHHASVAVVYPTVSVQGGWTFKGVTPDARRAHAAYKKVVGTMFWGRWAPGLLDLAGVDFDVVDEALLTGQAQQYEELKVDDFKYRTIILPGLSWIGTPLAAYLEFFVSSGGTLIAYEAIPSIVDDGYSGIVALRKRFVKLFTTDSARVVGDDDSFSASVAEIEQEVSATVPVHLRCDGVRRLLFVPGTYPCATTQSADKPWYEAQYRFDPSRYARVVEVTIRSPVYDPVIWDLFAGDTYRLDSVIHDNEKTILSVPIDSAPATLVTWSTVPVEIPPRKNSRSCNRKETRQRRVIPLEDVWRSQLIQTLDNRYGDFFSPPTLGPPRPATWEVEYCLIRKGTSRRWKTAHATFGAFGKYRKIGLQKTSEWKDACYSLSKGIYKDPTHKGTLGPKGRIPIEFLDFGRVVIGEKIEYRTVVDIEQPLLGFIGIGSSSEKSVMVSHSHIGTDDSRYYSIFPCDLEAGSHSLDIDFIAHQEGGLRAFFILFAKDAVVDLPEWLQIHPAEADRTVQIFQIEYDLPFDPVRAVVQVVADTQVEMEINGQIVGRQGGFDPYDNRRTAFPYRTDALREGKNTLTIRCNLEEEGGGLLIDGEIIDPMGRSLPIRSNQQWTTFFVGEQPRSAEILIDWKMPRTSEDLTSWLYRPPPHPLPEVVCDSEAAGVLGIEHRYPDEYSPDEKLWFRWTFPPGAQSVYIDVHGEPTLWYGDLLIEIHDGVARLPKGQNPATEGLLSVTPDPGFRGGAIFRRPIEYDVGIGTIHLGDWQLQGLEAYSGGVGYSNTFLLPPSIHGEIVELDLGHVRGTAEVRINGSYGGERFLTPFLFDITHLVYEGENWIEIHVYNTLAPYYNAVSPSSYVYHGQLESGLFGPVVVRILRSE